MTVHSLGGDLSERRPRSAVWLLPLLPVALAVFALSALVYYHVRQDAMGDARSALQVAIVGIYRSIGFVPSFLFFLLALTWGSIWFLTGKVEQPVKRLVRLLVLTLALAIWVNLRSEAAAPVAGTGAVGAWIAGRMMGVFGYILSTLVVAPVALGALLLATDFFFYRYFEELGAARTSRPRTAAGLAAEHGVEPAVSEHLKGLAAEQALTRGGAATVEPAPAESAPQAGHRPWTEQAAIDESARRWRGARAPLREPAAAGDAEAAADVVEEGGEEPDDRGIGALEADALAAASAAAQDDAGADAEGDQTADEAASEWRAARAWDTDEASEADAGPHPVAADEAEAGSLDDHAGDDAADDADAADGADQDADGMAAAGAAAADGWDVDPAASADGPIEADDAPAAMVAEDAVAATDADRDAEGEDGPLAAASAAEVGSGFEVAAAAEAEAEADAEADADEAATEPVVQIPRAETPGRQRRLFQAEIDEALVAEATELVTRTRRASATHLQRQLRIDYDQAMGLLSTLAERGVVEIAAGATQGRVLES